MTIPYHSDKLSQVLSLNSMLSPLGRPPQHPHLSTLTTLLIYSTHYLRVSVSPDSWMASRKASHCFHSFAVQALCCSGGRKDYRVVIV